MRIALCLSGLIGNAKGKSGDASSEQSVLDISFKYWKKHVLDKNDDIDVFIHTWDVDLEDRIKQLFDPLLITVEKQKIFDIPDYVVGHPEQRKQNHYSRWYGNREAVGLKREYEDYCDFKYDMVMLSRFDVAWQTDVIFSKFDSSCFYVGNWCTLRDKKTNLNCFKDGRGDLYERLETEPLSNFKHSHFPIRRGMLDHWFFSHSENIDNFAELYSNLDEYLKDPKASRDPNKPDSSLNICNHQLVCYHLQKLGLFDKVRCVFHSFSDFPLTRYKFLGSKI